MWLNEELTRLRREMQNELRILKDEIYYLKKSIVTNKAIESPKKPKFLNDKRFLIGKVSDI